MLPTQNRGSGDATSPISNPSSPPASTGKIRILCLEDNPNDAELLQDRLGCEGLDVAMTRVDTRGDFESALDRGGFDLVVSDYSMPNYSGREALKFAAERHADIPFIFFSGTIGEERAIETLRNGAADFVLKDHPMRLVSAIRRTLDFVQSQREQERAKAALRMKEIQYRTLVEQSIVGVYVIQDGILMYVNPTLATIVGHAVEEMVGRPVADFIAPGDRQLVGDNIKKRLAGQVSDMRYQLRMLHKSGAIVDVEAHGAVADCDGKPAIMGVLLDVGERKRAEKRIREQAMLLDKALNGMLVWDIARKIQYWNEGAHRLYGWSTEEACGHLVEKLLHRELLPEVQEAHRLVLENGEWHGELKQQTRDGRELVVECHWSLIRDEAGQPVSVFGVANDVTLQKKIDAEVRRSQRMDSIGALAGGIAHDLNNVLAPILMGLALLRDENLTDSGQKMVDVLESGARRGADMVKQILLFARGAEAEMRTLDLNRTVADAVKILRQMFPRSVKIESRPEEKLWPIFGDGTQLHQVIMNLSVNARDAMPNGGVLRIETKNVALDEMEARMYGAGHPGPYVLATVSDTGTGIPPEIIERIFEPFFTTKEVGKGTGLGLSTVIGIVKGQGGFVKVYSEVGQGTSFRLYFPARRDETAEAVENDSTDIPRGHGETVLLVDDEAALREITKGALEKYGYKVLLACDGAEALAIYAEHKGEINLVVTDMTMPILDGAATIQCLQRINPAVKVIAMSGLMMDHKADRIQKTENFRFLAKPFDSRKLLLVMKEMLQKG